MNANIRGCLDVRRLGQAAVISIAAIALANPAALADDDESRRASAAVFDHAAFDALLRKHVAPGGWVDYAGLERDQAQLDAYVAALANAPLDHLKRDERLALLINAYNAFTLKLILEHWSGGKLKSIMDIPEAKRWDAARWKLAGQTVSLNQIEHKLIRPVFQEPRIHFALVCAAVGCPPLRSEAYAAARLEAQLAAQTKYVHTHDRWFRYQPGAKSISLTRLYDWYSDDFAQAAGSVLKYVGEQSAAFRVELERGREPKIQWLEYDWRLNSTAYAP